MLHFVSKVFLIFILFTGSSNGVQAQMSDSLANYYYYVNQAELMIAENNLLGAKGKYEKALFEKKNWFGRDYYNLALLDLKLERSKEMMLTLEKLVKKGFNTNLLVEKESFKNYFATKKGKKDWEGLNELTPHYNKELRALYDSLYVADSVGTEEYDSEKYSPSIASMDSANIEVFMRLIEHHGFPTEDLIGIRGWFELDPIISIMRHHSKRPQIGKVFDFLGLIHQSFDDGIIKNYAMFQFVASVSSYNQSSLRGEITQWKVMDKINSTVEVQVYSDSLFTFSFKEAENEYNIVQQSKGLPTSAESLKLSKFNWEVKSDYILGRAQRNTYAIDDVKTIQFFDGTYQEIDIIPYVRD